VIYNIYKSTGFILKRKIFHIFYFLNKINFLDLLLNCMLKYVNMLGLRIFIMSIKTEILSWIENEKNEIIAFLQEFIRA